MNLGNLLLSRCVLLAMLCFIFLGGMPLQVYAQPPSVATQSAAKSIADNSALLLGVAWYPEQWSEPEWEKDLALMQKAGVRMVRIGEYAWSTMEPKEGKFNFHWMDRAIAAAARYNMVTVLGTPTDTPPAWLTQKYPETLRIDDKDRTMEHGIRRQWSYSSPRYLKFCQRIVAKMAQRFGNNPNVIGWQIGNEFTDDSFDKHSQKLFQEWLHKKYKTLNELNRRWTTAHWSQTYSRWDQVPMGRGYHNPGLMLDYKRFVTDQWREFVALQKNTLLQHINPQQFITTNLGGLGWADRFNRQQFSQDFDFISWDNYVGQGHLDPYRNGATHDLVWGWKRQNFWVMELAPGFVSWAPVSNSLNRGETRRMAWQAIGHGADAIVFWQWRNALNGQESLHGHIVGPDGDPVPIYEEVQQLGQEMAKASAALKGTIPTAEIALIHDYESRWAFAVQSQQHSREFDPISVLLDFYKALRDAAQAVHIIAATEPLNDYKLVVAPWLNVLPEELGTHLLEFVKNGGHLVLGPRSGMKDKWNALHENRQPGPLVEPLGGRVEQFYALIDKVPVSGIWGEGSVSIWADQLSTKSQEAKVLMRYGKSNGWLDNQPAAIERQIGKGKITYVGGLMDKQLLHNAVHSWLKDANITPAWGPLLEGVEVSRRSSPDRDVFVLINHSRNPVSFELPQPMHDILNNNTLLRTVQLPVEGVSVLTNIKTEGAKEKK